MKSPALMSSLAAASLLAGCASFTPGEDFDVTLVNVVSGEVQPWETTLVFTVRLQNATPGPVTITGAAHKVYLDDAYVGQGLSNERVVIPRLGDAEERVTVRVRNFTLARKLYAASRSGRITYRVRSTLYPEGGRPARAVKEGSLDVGGLRLPAAAETPSAP
jgi:LEA14-like dessication related protein